MWRTTGATNFHENARQEAFAAWSAPRARRPRLDLKWVVVVSSHQRP
jgi:hypothetical protein